ncbi:MAG: glycosyltransferase family 4 protein [Anaerolineales bacterium]|nr:glycosyltransferase family 4 protein [Anaerolineales bacterium]
MTAQPSRFSVLLLGTQMELGGAQQMLLTQAAWLHSQGYPVRVAFLYDKQGLADTWRAAYPFEILSLDAWRSGGSALRHLPRLLRGLWRLLKLLREVQVVEAFTQHSNLIGLPLAWLRGVPVRLASLHGAVANPLGLLSFLHARLVNSGVVSGLVVVSEEVRQLALADGVRLAKIRLIENGIDLALPPMTPEERQSLRAQAGAAPRDILLMAVGRLAPVKDHVGLLRALATLPEPRPRLAVLGEGELRAELEGLAAEWGLAERVRFLGNQPAARRWLQAADVYVQPSLSEGLSIALLEAMASGLPIVATQVGAAGKLIRDGEHGLLVPPEDTAALSVALQRLLADPALRSRLGRGARQAAQPYSAEQMCNNYARLMTELLNETR